MHSFVRSKTFHYCEYKQFKHLVPEAVAQSLTAGLRGFRGG